MIPKGYAKQQQTVPPAYAPMEAVREFHQAFNIPYLVGQDAYQRQKTMKLRWDLIAEEYKELSDEFLDMYNGDGNYARLAKELADLLYVIYGAADLLDIPLERVFNEVHRSNMSKLSDDGKPLLREDGKILKGPGYRAPNVEAVIFELDQESDSE